MKIESFHIQGFKSIADLKVDGLSDINIFFGLNDVGKSNIFQALALWYRLLVSPEELPLEQLNKEFNAPIFQLGKDNGIQIQVTLLPEFAVQQEFANLSGKGVPQEKSKLNRATEIRIVSEIKIALLPSARVSYSTSYKVFVGVEELYDLLGNDRNWFMTKFKTIKANRRFQIERWEQRNGLDSVGDHNLKQGLFFTYLSRDQQQKQRFEAIKRILAEPPFNLGVLDVALNPETNEIDIGFIRENGRLPIENVGSGVQQLLLMLGQVFFNDYPIIALEEPEMNLSPQYQGLLLSTLRQLMQDPAVKLNQLFISTHSPYLEFQENFYDVTRDEQGYTQVRRASRESHQSYFAITPTGPDTGARVNSLNQVKLYDRLMEDLALQRGDLVFFLKNENGRWEIRPEAEVLPEVDEALNGSANQQA